MAKLRRSKLTWQPSKSDQVVGYRLYWSKGLTVNYDSDYINLGKVSEVTLPDILKDVLNTGETVMFGITAMDELGNESDMATLAEPYRLMVPPAPAGFSLASQDDFEILEPKGQVAEQFELLFEEDPYGQELEELARMAEPLLESASVESGGTYGDDGGSHRAVIPK